MQSNLERFSVLCRAILFVVGFLIILGISGASVGRAEAEQAKRPNLLLLLSDDHSYPYVSCYGDTNVKTPVLDSLAATGLKCHRFFTTAPQCVPSRASLMTGRSPVAARITRFSSPLDRAEITFAELLREQAGYYTGICGRGFHLDGPGKGAGTAISEFIVDQEMKTFDTRVDFLRSCADKEVAAQMTRFLKEKPVGKPWFMWANYSDPHHPWKAPSALRPDPASLKLPRHLPDLPGVREQLADYCAEVNQLDQSIGAIIDVLKQQGEYQNTLIVFCGDNGMAFPHGKGSLYDPGCNTPLLVHWAGVTSQPRESFDLISGEDIAPTMLAAAGVAATSKMSGKSFLNLIEHEAFTPREYVFIERGPHGLAPVSATITSNGYDLSRAVRSERYKLIYNCTPWLRYSPVDSGQGAGWLQMSAAAEAGHLSAPLLTAYFTSPRPVYEFFDLLDDPNELNNLSGQKAVREIEMLHRLELAKKMIVDFDYLPIPDVRD